MARILVTGAAGFIGSHTVDALLAAGHTVIGLDNFRTGKEENLRGAAASSSFLLQRGDIAEGSTIHDAIAEHRPDAVIHLAALVSVQESLAQPDLNYRLNVHATHLVAEAVRRNSVPRLVFASSAAVYGRAVELPVRERSEKAPLSPYGWAKLASECLLFSHAQSFGGTAICLRYFNVYGDRQDPTSPYSGVITLFRRKLQSGEPLTIFGDGEQTRDFIHVSDIARANVLAATAPALTSAALNVCTGRAVTLNTMVEVLSAGAATRPEIQYLPKRGEDIEHSAGDPSAAQSALAFSARVSLEEGLRTGQRGGVPMKPLPSVA